MSHLDVRVAKHMKVVVAFGLPGPGYLRLCTCFATSPNQVLTHAARVAAKQLFSHLWWPRARRAREGLWLEELRNKDRGNVERSRGKRKLCYRLRSLSMCRQLFFDGRRTSTILCSRSRCGAREAMTVGCKPTSYFWSNKSPTRAPARARDVVEKCSSLAAATRGG